MSQSFPTFNENAGGDDVRTGLLNERSRTDTLRSNFSGTSFPSTPVIGQHCYRTDQGIEYVCTATTPSAVWAEVRTGTVPLNKGGTGATDASGARAALALGSAALLTAGTGSTEVQNNSQADAKYLAKSQNLNDLPDKAAARTNLALGSAAQYNASAFATAAQGALADTALQPGDVNVDFTQVITEFTSSGTWTKDANLIFAIVEVVGGGGGGGSGSSGNSAGGAGAGGGTSSFGTHCSATGGGGGGPGGGVGYGGNPYAGGSGSGSGGNVNRTASPALAGCSTFANGGGAGGIPFGGGALGCGGFGGGGSTGGSSQPNYSAGGGGGGGYSKKVILASALGATETVTVGAGGARATAGGILGLAGGAGYVRITEFRRV